MAKANIKLKTKNATLKPESLNEHERALLRTAVTGHGKLVSAAEAIDVNRHTIYNAIYGRPLIQVNLVKIRNFLASKSSANEPTQDIAVSA